MYTCLYIIEVKEEIKSSGNIYITFKLPEEQKIGFSDISPNFEIFCELERNYSTISTKKIEKSPSNMWHIGVLTFLEKSLLFNDVLQKRQTCISVVTVFGYI